jgi:hypothetical protein
MAPISFIILAIFISFVSSNDEHDTIRITNSGSTNTAGYVIELQRNGIVKWNVAPRFRLALSTTTTAPGSTTSQNSIRLPSLRTNSIFQAVEQAFPFDQYAPVFCIKSVSFGTRLYVTYNGQQTPDLSCPVKDQRLVIVNKYIQELIAELNINTRG